MSAFRVLHLSDMHIGKTYKKPVDIAYKIISDLDHNGLCSLKSVLITGDVFDGQVAISEELIDEAVNFFEVILEQINLNQEECKISKEDFVFIPGNHDLIRVDNEEEQWSKYKRFLLKFFGDIPEYYNQSNFSVIKKYDEGKIVFIGFNSCQIEKRKVLDAQYVKTFKKHVNENVLASHGMDKNTLLNILENEASNEYDDFGYISMAQITDIKRKVKKLDDFNVVALFHHHFYLFPEIAREFGDSSLIRNYTEVLQHLQYMNVKTVLHGHKHFDLERPFITDDYYETTESIIDVFAGGSVGTARKERHTFSVIDFYDKKNDIKLIQNKFIYNNEALEPIARKQIPPQNVTNRIVKLLEMLNILNPEAHNCYTQTVEKIFKTYKTCNEITNWVSEAITGFKDVYKFLDNDYKNILYLLYAINYRTLSYKAIVGQERSYYESSSVILKQFFNDQLATSNFNVTSEEFHSLFEIKKLKDLANQCDQLIKNCTDKKTQQYLAFSMIGIFFSDLYLVLTEYADDFKESIKYKVNIKIEENKFHENVPAPRIVIQSDSDRRSAYVQLLCNDATAHKMAVLFVKEFDLIINKFEDYFKMVGLKLYYLVPKIDKDRMTDTLDNYNFEAYIPTLLPLLTGDNIYPSKVVFARELIQNSIDAIAVREAKENVEFTKEILIDIGNDANGKRYFKIRDYGTGMDRYKIERYFTSIGRSFYSGDEYAELNISYKPISNFGIGFLSSFMVCQEIDVRTKYFLPNSESLKLHIPNYDGCFFIERDKINDVGTELTLHLNCDLENRMIIGYIQKIMLDIKYDIVINVSNDDDVKRHRIPAHLIRERNKKEKSCFFVPLTEHNEVLDIDYEKEVATGEFIRKYEHGLMIFKHPSKEENKNFRVLNSGILVEQATFVSLFGKEFNEKRDSFFWEEIDDTHCDIILNLPASWIQIDVSREKTTGFSEHIKSLSHPIAIQIAEVLYNQIKSFLQHSKENKVDLPISYLQEVIHHSIRFCGGKSNKSEVYKKLSGLKYVSKITYTLDGVVIEMLHREIVDDRVNISYENEDARKVREEWIGKHNKNKGDEFIHIGSRVEIEDEMMGMRSYEFERYLHRMLNESFLHSKNSDVKRRISATLKNSLVSNRSVFSRNDIINLSVIILLQIPDKINYKDYDLTPVWMLERVVMQRLKISDVENNNNKILVRYDDLDLYFQNKSSIM